MIRVKVVKVLHRMDGKSIQPVEQELQPKQFLLVSNLFKLLLCSRQESKLDLIRKGGW